MEALIVTTLLWALVMAVTIICFLTEPGRTGRNRKKKPTDIPLDGGSPKTLSEKKRRKKKMTISKERLAAMRERHPAGTRITLQSMNDPYSRLQPGDTGTLVLIDDIGTYHVKWDNGSSLGLIPGEDSFSCLPPEQHNLKLWMPLTASLESWDGPSDPEAYTGSRKPDHSLAKNREHGRIQERKTKEKTPWHGENTQRHSRPKSFLRCCREHGNWRSSQRTTV